MIDREELRAEVDQDKYIKLNYEVLIQHYGFELKEAVIYSLIRSFNKTGNECRYSQEKLGKLFGLSLKTTKRVLKKLLEKGAITQEYVKTSRGMVVVYKT